MQGPRNPSPAQGNSRPKKTPGTLVFKPSALNNLLLSLDESLISKARMAYRIETLSFGKGNGTVDFPIAHKSKNI